MSEESDHTVANGVESSQRREILKHGISFVLNVALI